MAAEPTFTETARRAQIVAAAVDVLADEGFRAASLARIADRAGISKGLILYHFASKEELLRQVLFDTVGALAEGATAGLDFTAPPAELLRAVIRRSARVGVERARERRAIRQIIANLGQGAAGERHVFPSDAAPLIRGIEQLYLVGQRAGAFRPDFDTHVMAVTHQAAVDAMYTQLDADPATDPDAYADALAGLLLAAVAVPDGGAVPDASRDAARGRGA